MYLVLIAQNIQYLSVELWFKWVERRSGGTNHQPYLVVKAEWWMALGPLPYYYVDGASIKEAARESGVGGACGVKWIAFHSILPTLFYGTSSPILYVANKDPYGLYGVFAVSHMRHKWARSVSIK